jgi:hypothetical protein
MTMEKEWSINETTDTRINRFDGVQERTKKSAIKNHAGGHSFFYEDSI